MIMMGITMTNKNREKMEQNEKQKKGKPRLEVCGLREWTEKYLSWIEVELLPEKMGETVVSNWQKSSYLFAV